MRHLSTHAGPSMMSPGSVIGAGLTSIREFLVFKLGCEEYGLDILRVQEVCAFETPSPMASAPPHVLGVVELRGQMVPIIDMRLKFKLTQVNYDLLTAVIVFKIGNQVVGVVVDGLTDVITLTPEQQPAVLHTASAIGSGRALLIDPPAERLLITLDIEHLVSNTELALFRTEPHRVNSFP